MSIYRETYRGVRIIIRKGRQWGTLNTTIGGENQGDLMGTDPVKHAASWHGYIDMAEDRPGAFSPCFTPTEPKEDRA